MGKYLISSGNGNCSSYCCHTILCLFPESCCYQESFGHISQSKALKIKNVPEAIAGEDGAIIPSTLDLIDENPGFSGHFKIS